ncbi:MAG: hypothetical protein P9D89_03675 [Candidatus Contendobacter sp.]|nr:hypothetical protein [Candidatus Contendobacter sp.]
MPSMTPNGRELSGTRTWVERPACRPGNPKRAQAVNAVSGVRSNESSTARSAENSMLAQLAPVHRREAPMNV